MTSCVSNCGPVLQGHVAKTSRERTEIDLMRRNCGIVIATWRRVCIKWCHSQLKVGFDRGKNVCD